LCLPRLGLLGGCSSTAVYNYGCSVLSCCCNPSSFGLRKHPTRQAANSSNGNQVVPGHARSGLCGRPSGRPPRYRSLLPYHTVALCAVRAGYLLYIIVGVQCCVVAACQAASGLRRHPTREAANSSARTAIKLYLAMLGRDVPRPVRATASIQVAAALPHCCTVRSARSVPAATPSSL